MRFFKRSLIVAILFLASFAQASEAERPTYKLNLENDFPVTLAAGGMFGIGMFLYSRMDTPDNPKDKGNLLPWDKPLAGRYSENADRASDIGSVFAIAPLVVGGIAWHDGSSTGGEFATFTVMFLQAIGIGNGINLAIRSLEIWPRPYMYAESGDGREKAENAKKYLLSCNLEVSFENRKYPCPVCGSWNVANCDPGIFRYMRVVCYDCGAFRDRDGDDPWGLGE